MFLFLLVVFVVLPIVEVAVFIEMASALGFFSAVGWVILASIVGVWLVKRQGLSTLRRANEKIAAGNPPTRELVDGVLILGAGALMLFPGFVTDVAGILLLLPPVRALLAVPLSRRFAARSVTMTTFSGPWGGASFGARRGGDYLDVDSWDVTDSSERRELP